MDTWQIWLFYLVFLMQIVLISHLFPKRLLARMDYVLEHYPQADYPRLYPRSAHAYRLEQSAFKWANHVIALIGLVLLAILMRPALTGANASGAISEAWPAIYAMVQALPLVVFELACFRQFKLMRQANTARVRQAPLQRRKLTHYVHPVLPILAITAALAAVFLDLWSNSFSVAWGDDTVVKAATLLLCNSLLAAIAGWQIYGRKPDPHQDWEDHRRQVAVIMRSFVYVSLVASVFFAIKTLESVYQPPDLDAVLISLYVQAIALVSLGEILRATRPEQFNFEVYRETGNNTAPSSYR